MYLSQISYLEKILDKFSMKSTKPVIQPLGSHFMLSASQSPTIHSDKSYMESLPYSSVVGSVMYFMVCTRPDLAQEISVFSGYISNPRKEH